ncbi:MULTISPECIES: phosphoglucosamine mutase [Dehalobacter]|uniref:Phosphoglucosamine mutase n=1 Tax=Dehalobacter restrictus (strain DSM 9455 / PER-K23) TaxID=871738 RepID=A0ABN4BYU4_DEHRP|nr:MULTISPECIES: phosphoglucosamine mutase [Dehalobacter]AHF10802.1 phosphoglucosamine mutase [Dehalobacter restrictus DSM 9455]MCG1026655.1 phosphoglucosamine mutase [Dehalobacter sp.]MDJ0306992.1 phosphoglucosamine mutase [Dehalobacter sp.]OCZ54222.1 phosphoglucosamine mutase [Dehalobacter sp. TeCB1]
MARLFGTDGVRGKANTELTPELAFKLGKAGAYVLGKGQEKAKIVIGKDTRISGDMLEAALAAGICSMGVDVLKAGVLPTPGIAFLTRTLEASAGVVISASHNPYEDNGIKFFAGSGFKLSDELEDEIEDTLKRIDELELPSGGDIGSIVEVENASEKYAAFLKKTSVSLKGLKIILDCANGAAYEVGPKVLADLGAEVIPLYNQPDGININVHCGSTHPEALAKEVLQHGADLGLACDGDADRIIAVDENGNILDGDAIMVICARALKDKGKLAHDSLVVTVMSNMGLHKALRKAGIRILETKVGDRYVMEKLLESGAILGGEQSGHLIFLEHNTTGDGLLSGLQLLSVIKEKKAKLSELAKQMKRFPQVLVNTSVGSKDKIMQNEQVNLKVREVQESLGEDGRILVRPSGTESLIRVMLEGPDQQELTRLAEEVIKVVSIVDQNDLG